jgi:hypothetical protein
LSSERAFNLSQLVVASIAKPIDASASIFKLFFIAARSPMKVPLDTEEGAG